MRIVHFSDTHLGYSAYPAFDRAAGLNQREIDVYTSFRQAVDLALSLKPDIVLHTGDLFHSVRPNNNALAKAFEELRRLGEAGIPLVIISGNHEMPRMKSAASVFRLLDLPEFGMITPVYDSKYEVIQFADIAVHAVPQCFTPEILAAQLKRVKPDKSAKYNILMLHAAIAGVPEFSMGDFSEQVIPEKVLTAGFDYIALGHCHRHAKVRTNAWYAGSEERFSFREAGQPKGIVAVELDPLRVTFHKLELRPMGDLPAVDATGLDAPTLQKRLESAIAASAAGGIFRLTITNADSAVRSSLDHNRLRQLTKRVSHLDIRYESGEMESVEPSGEPVFGNLTDEWREFMAGQKEPRGYKNLLELGLDYLDRAARERS